MYIEWLLPVYKPNSENCHVADEALCGLPVEEFYPEEFFHRWST